MKRSVQVLQVCMLILGSIIGLSGSCYAQTYTATLTGTVTDPNGGAVANVKVMAVHQGTKLEHTAQTSDSGVYTLPFLPIGDYVVTVEATGFRKLVSNPITLEVNQIARVDLKLVIGDLTQEVMVSDVAPILQTESTTVGQVISGNTTVNLPLNGRSFQQLTLLVPGSISPNVGSFTSPQPNTTGGRPYVNGNREQGNAFLLDGISVDETLDNLLSYKPSIDSIAEFRVETSNSSSEFGNVTGATVLATTKSGTNQFHGDVFEFFRNDALDAQSWSNNKNGVKVKPKLRQNIFGGTLGGPVISNKLFFFVDYQGAVQRTGGASTIAVAPAAWRTGDLSSLGVTIRDPQNCTKPSDTTTCQPFAGGIIPQSRIVNPIAKALFANPQLYPLPNRINPVNHTGVLDVVTSDRFNAHQFDIRMDSQLSGKDTLMGRYSFSNNDDIGDKGSIPLIPTPTTFTRPQSLVFNWTHTFSPKVINEARVGVSRAYIIQAVNDWAGVGNADATLGIPGTQLRSGLSSISLGNGLTTIGSLATDSNNATNTFHYGDNLTIQHERHTFKMGGQWLRYQQNRFYAGNNGLLGYFSYGGTFSGQGFADFLLDDLSGKGIGGGISGTNKGTWGHRQNRVGFFFQDDYKIRNNLTLNLGVRWEYTSPVVEVDDRQANFDITTGKELFAGVDGNSRALYKPFHKGFEPRIGFAWTPARFENRFVVRAGYGITQYMEGTGSNLRLPLNPPFFSEVDQPYDTSSGPGTITTGFTDLIAKNQIAGQLRIWNPDLRPQFTQQWNLTLEYELLKGTSISAAYVGNRATHLVAPTDINQPLPETDPALAGDPTKWRPAQQRRPLYSVYPLVTQTSVTDSWAVSNYNSLQLSVRQRFSRGLEFLTSYTLSKTMTDNLGYYGSAGVASQSAYSGNAYDRHEFNYGPAFFDARHNLSISGTYELPLGKGRRFGSNFAPAVNAILGGWNIGNIVQYHTGFPMTVTSSVARSQQSPRGTEHPNFVAEPTINTGIPDCYIYNPNNSACPAGGTVGFALPALGTFGNAGVGILRAPGYFNTDFSLGKKLNLTESKYFDFRAEFFNFTNTPSFNPPSVSWSSTSNTFGQITSTISSARNIEFVLKFNF
ncbi:MAG: TonB-dependent receptor [Blastocatellia bacterium]|nr:TonB-dependent receptor [Blastocatellia bacterium]